MTTTKKQRRSFTQEFKDSAVALVLSGRRARDVADELDIEVSVLNRWKQNTLQKQDAQHDGVGISPSQLAAENKRLRRELAEQKQITEILKKRSNTSVEPRRSYAVYSDASTPLPVIGLVQGLRCGVTSSSYYRWKHAKESARHSEQSRAPTR